MLEELPAGATTFLVASEALLETFPKELQSIRDLKKKKKTDEDKDDEEENHVMVNIYFITFEKSLVYGGGTGQ